MSRQYPIWNEVESCIYESKKSFGAKDTSTMVVRIGTSSKTSLKFATVQTTRRERGIYWVFKIGIDDQVIKTKYFNTKTKEFSDVEPLDYEK